MSVSRQPLEAHQFDWYTKPGLIKGLTHLPLQDDIIEDLLSGSVSDQVDTLIAYYPPAELKSVLICLYQVAQLDRETLKLKSLSRKDKLRPVLKSIINRLMKKGDRNGAVDGKSDEEE
jgi:hypothetical protein